MIFTYSREVVFHRDSPLFLLQPMQCNDNQHHNSNSSKINNGGNMEASKSLGQLM